jgi:hypothetical protein
MLNYQRVSLEDTADFILRALKLPYITPERGHGHFNQDPVWLCLKEVPLTGLKRGSHFFWSVACDLQSLPAIVSLQRGTSQTEETT